MSSSGSGGQYRINIVWTSHGGQALATMGQITGGMRTVGQTAARESRNLGYFNRQMQAIGTTMRYMFAGGAIFGSMSAFRQFAEFQSALGGIAAISQNLSRSDITDLGNQLLTLSTSIATPVLELEQSARNIQSTMQLTQQEAKTMIPGFAEMFGKGAKVAESDAYNFGNAIMGMRNAFDLALTDMENIAGQFFTTIEKSAGMTGDEWAKFSGRVVAGANIAGANLQEMNALMVLMTRQGGTAATNVRHLAQFLQRLRDPTQEAAPKWAEIGLGPEELQTLPYAEIINRIKTAVKAAGGITRGKKLSEETILGLEEGGDITPEALGIKGGGAALLTELFGRMESRRAALIVISEMLSPKKEGLETYEELLKTFGDTEQQAVALDEAFAKWLDRNRIQQATNALKNMMTEALVPAEKQISGIAKWMTDMADPRIVQGAAAAVAAYGAGRFIIGGGKALRGVGRYARGLGTAGLAINQMGAAPPTGSFANPFWVIIHPLSNIPGMGGLGVPGGGRPRGGGKGIPPILPGGGGPNAGGSRWSRAGKGVRNLLPRAKNIARAVPGGMALTAAMELAFPDEAGISGNESALANQNVAYAKSKWAPGFEKWARAKVLADNPKAGEAAILETILRNNFIWMQQFRMTPGATGNTPEQLTRAQKAAQQFKISGVSAVEESRLGIFVDASDDAKKLLKINITGGGAGARVHVPVGHTAWQNGATPQFRGNNQTYRGPH